MGRLEGQVAIVTGGASGLGLAFAERLLSEDCRVVITDRDPSVVDVAATIGADGHHGDVADPDHVRAVVDTTVTNHGRIDILISNAGEVRRSSFRDDWNEASDLFDRIVGSNTKGAYLFGRAVVPVMIDGGRGGNIVNISTDHVKPGPGCAEHHGHGSMDLYNASKWALNGLTFDWAASLARHGIRVNNMCMGATDTDMLRGWYPPDPGPDVVADWMRPEQVAQVLFDLLDEGPDGRTADNVGLYAGQPCVLPLPHRPR